MHGLEFDDSMGWAPGFSVKAKPGEYFECFTDKDENGLYWWIEVLKRKHGAHFVARPFCHGEDDPTGMVDMIEVEAETDTMQEAVDFAERFYKHAPAFVAAMMEGGGE